MNRTVALVGKAGAIHNRGEPQSCVCGRETCGRRFDGRRWSVLCSHCVFALWDHERGLQSVEPAHDQCDAE